MLFVKLIQLTMLSCILFTKKVSILIFNLHLYLLHLCVSGYCSIYDLRIMLAYFDFRSIFQKISADTIGDEVFFDLLSRFQSNRMDDQRCCLQEQSCGTASTPSTPPRLVLKSKLCFFSSFYSSFISENLVLITGGTVNEPECRYI